MEPLSACPIVPTNAKRRFATFTNVERTSDSTMKIVSVSRYDGTAGVPFPTLIDVTSVSSEQLTTAPRVLFFVVLQVLVT